MAQANVVLIQAPAGLSPKGKGVGAGRKFTYRHNVYVVSDYY
jgi:hypothetical protein